MPKRGKRYTERNLGAPARATLSFSPKEGISSMQETANCRSSPGVVRVTGSFGVPCLSHKEGAADPQ